MAATDLGLTDYWRDHPVGGGYKKNYLRTCLSTPGGYKRTFLVTPFHISLFFPRIRQLSFTYKAVMAAGLFFRLNRRWSIRDPPLEDNSGEGGGDKILFNTLYCKNIFLIIFKFDYPRIKSF